MGFFFFFFFFFVRAKLVLLAVAACLLLSGYFGALSAFYRLSSIVFSPATILHGRTHSPAQSPDAVSDSLTLASSHTYSQGVVKVGLSLLTVIALGGPDCT